MSGERWYAVQTHTHAERKAEAHLRNQAFGTYLPLVRKRRSHARKVEQVKAPMFPGYLFLSMDVARARWRAINSTFGVRGLVASAERPLPVPVGIVEALRATEDADGLVTLNPLAGLKRGDAVEILGGAFDRVIGAFDGISAPERVAVLLELMGRQVRVQVGMDQVARCG